MTRPGSTIGVLALQGGFAAHAAMLQDLGARVREVRTPVDLEGLAGLVLPGGESTTMMLGIAREGLAEPLAEFVRSGAPVLATCAGAIILDDAHLKLIEITCERNAFGGQIHSFEADLKVDGLSGDSFRGVFIRAPRLTRVGAGVRTLATHDGEPVAVRHGSVTAMSFHPELAGDDRIHRMFLESFSAGEVSEIDLKRQAA